MHTVSFKMCLEDSVINVSYKTVFGHLPTILVHDTDEMFVPGETSPLAGLPSALILPPEEC